MRAWHRVVGAALGVVLVTAAPGVAVEPGPGPLPGSYVVVLEGLTPETGELRGTQDTEGADRAMTAAQDAVLGSVTAEPAQRFSTVLNGFSAPLSAAEVADLRADPRVASVTPVRLLEPHAVGDLPALTLPATDRSPTALGLDGPGGLWSQVGGRDAAGRGQVVGIVDSGLAHANPSFDPVGSMSAPAGWAGTCQRGTDSADWPRSACDGKVIGARLFDAGLAGYGLSKAGDESSSPADTDGHGTHVAGIAVGRARAAGDVTITGAAPAAHLAVYKACWRVEDGTACAEDDLLAAVDAAVRDGVDVLNISVGLPAEPAYGSDPYALGLRSAAAAGVFIAMSGGNSGPTGTPRNRSVSNGLPWVATVAAATHRGPASTTPAVSGFSSRGPVTGVRAEEMNLLKPDLGASGEQVRSALPGPVGHGTKSGTSMAAPHVAGVAAIVQQARPGWSPMAVRSALQTTARPYATPAGPFAGGSGHLTGGSVLDPGLVFDAGLPDWTAFSADLSRGYRLNTASVMVGALRADGPTTVARRLTNVSDSTQTWTASWSGPSTLQVTFSPRTLTLEPGATATVSMRVRNVGASPTAWQSGTASWTSPTGPSVSVPVVGRGALPRIEPVSGSNRFATAAAIARKFPAGVDTVYLADGRGFPDALAGGPAAARGHLPAGLSGSGAAAPLLLTDGANIPGATATVLAELRPRNVVILGGTTTVPGSIGTSLRSQGYAVQRVAGTDRYGTAAAIARLGPTRPEVVYLVDGAAPWDALAATPLAVADDAPILLNRPSGAHPATLRALADLDPERIVVIGGENAVSSTAYGDHGATERIAGTRRGLTAVRVSQRLTGPEPVAAVLTSARQWPDALAGAVLAASWGAPVLLTDQDSLDTASLAELERLSPRRLLVLGGTDVIGTPVRTRLDERMPTWVREDLR